MFGNKIDLEKEKRPQMTIIRHSEIASNRPEVAKQMQKKKYNAAPWKVNFIVHKNFRLMPSWLKPLCFHTNLYKLTLCNIVPLMSKDCCE